MLIKLVCDSWNHPCLVFDPIRLPSPGGKDNKSNVRRDCHDVVSPTSLNSKQCGSRLALFCHVALDRVETYHRPILINLKRKLQLLRVKHHIRPSKDNSLLIKHSNTMNYWSQADSGNVIFWLRRTNSLFFVGMYTLPQNRFFFFAYTAWKSAHLALRYLCGGMEKWPRRMLVPLLFFLLATEGENSGMADGENVILSALWYLYIFKLMPCLK